MSLFINTNNSHVQNHEDKHTRKKMILYDQLSTYEAANEKVLHIGRGRVVCGANLLQPGGRLRGGFQVAAQTGAVVNLERYLIH